MYRLITSHGAIPLFLLPLNPSPSPPHSKFPVTQVNCAPYYDDIMIPASHGPEQLVPLINGVTFLLLDSRREEELDILPGQK
jgi:hypothetical protein